MEWIAEQYQITEDKIRYLDGVLAYMPTDFSCYVHVLKATELHKNRQLKLAARAYQLALDAPPQHRCLIAQLNLARVKYALREYSSSKLLYEKWVKAHPEDDEALSELQNVKEIAPDMRRDFNHLDPEQIQKLKSDFIRRSYGSRVHTSEEEADGESVLV